MKKMNGFIRLCAVLMLCWPWNAEARPKGKVIELETQKVEGQLQKPEVYYVIMRSELRFQELMPQKNLIDLIKASVKKTPF